jgi:5-methyltetrahydrofolate--homocysteine methyltransferase
MADVIDTIFDAVLRGDRTAVPQQVELALAEGLDPEKILKEGLIAAMKEVGDRFEHQDLFVPEMLACAKAMQAGLADLRPHLQSGTVEGGGRVLLGTVKGDLHDIGKNLVAMMLEGAGFEVVDLGTDVPPERFAAEARQSGAQLVGLSALLTTTMVNMRSTIEAIEDLGIRKQVKVMIGGAPVTDAFASEIGADGYAPDASRAVALAKALLSKEGTAQ